MNQVRSHCDEIEFDNLFSTLQVFALSFPDIDIVCVYHDREIADCIEVYAKQYGFEIASLPDMGQFIDIAKEDLEETDSCSMFKLRIVS